MLILGDYGESESIEIENKEYHLYPHVLANMSEESIFNIVMTGQWTSEFQKIVENSLLEFLSNILPKYVTCFTNAKINGVINIGVNDDYNELTGIPILGNLTSDYQQQILESVTQTLYQNLDLTEKEKKKIVDSLQIEYLPLKIETGILNDDSDRYFGSYSSDIIEYNDKMDRYLEEHALFLKEHRKYTQKLDKMLNTTKYRQELADFIGKNSQECGHLIDQLLGKEYILMKQDNIQVDKSNPQKMFYWIAEFRKVKTSLLKKPIKPSHPSIYHPKQILGNLPSLRAKFLSNNPGLNYYLIKIVCRVGDLDLEVKYRDKYSNKWLYRTRIDTLKVNGPGCI